MRLAWCVLFLLLAPRAVFACVVEGNETFVPDPEPSDDRSPPGEVSVAEVRFQLNTTEESEDGCTSSTGSTCGRADSLSFGVAAIDDRTPAEQLGYRVRVVSGESPGLGIGSSPVLASDGRISFRYASDSPPFSFELGIRAIDTAGNVGPEATFVVEDPRPPPQDSGCSSSLPPTWFAGVVIAIAIGLRPRARRFGYGGTGHGNP